MAARPRIDSTQFGSITIDGILYDHDVVIHLDGQVQKRRKGLSRAIYGTSHTISLDEAEHVYQEGALRLVLGTGQIGLTKLSDRAAGFFEANACRVHPLPTPEAIDAWNDADDAVIGLFHVTC